MKITCDRNDSPCTSALIIGKENYCWLDKYTWLFGLGHQTFPIEIHGKLYLIKVARAKLPLKISIFLMLSSCCPFSGQTGNGLSEWGQASKTKDKLAWGMNLLH